MQTTLSTAAHRLVTACRDWIRETITDYETVRDETGELLRDENGVPLRDARDLPPATEPSYKYPHIDVRIVHGREGPAARNRPTITYKVTHIDIETDHEFDDTFGQYFAVHRKKAGADSGRPAYDSISPRYLTDLERIKRLEYIVHRIATEPGRPDVTVTRLSPIAFKISDIETASDRRSVFTWINTRLRGRIGGSGVDFYNAIEDETGDVYVWAKHIYSYSEWRDEDETYMTYADTVAP